MAAHTARPPGGIEMFNLKSRIAIAAVSVAAIGAGATTAA
jgi:hypothetical protein